MTLEAEAYALEAEAHALEAEAHGDRLLMGDERELSSSMMANNFVTDACAVLAREVLATWMSTFEDVT
jgi:hypothetical protein